MSKNNETVFIGNCGSDFLSSYNISQSIDNSGNELKALITPEIDMNSSSGIVKILKSFLPDEIHSDYISPDIKPLVKNKSVSEFNSEKSFEKNRVHFLDRLDHFHRFQEFL